MKSSFLLLAALWVSLFSLSTNARAQIDPDAVEVMKDMVATYQGISSYSDKSDVNVSVFQPGTGKSLTTTQHVQIAWQKGMGFRIEGTHHDYDHFVAISDGEQVHTHWIPHTYVDSDVPLDGDRDFLTQVTPGLPYAIADLGFLTGGVTLQKLEQLNVSRLTLEKNTLFTTDTGGAIPCTYIEMKYTTPKGHAVTLTMFIQKKDNVILFATQDIQFENYRSSVSIRHSDISDQDSFPSQYWTLDAPLMGEAATVTAPSQPALPGIASTLPTITAQDVFGKTFTISPQDKKTTLIYFFTPGDAEYIIDNFQQLAREGDLRGLQLVGVVKNLGTPAARTRTALQAFLTRHKITFPVYADEGTPVSLTSLQQQLGDRGGAATLIYGANGQLKSDASLIKPRELRAVLNSIAPIPLH
jgi:peroxiredoxin